MKTNHFIISQIFARNNELPVSFNAIILRETAKAYYVFGHGVMDPAGRCCKCGRTLTHPGSILIGIGPECLGSWGARDAKLENMTEADQAQLKSLMAEQKIDQWIPKSIVKELNAEVVDGNFIKAPADHKMVVSQSETPTPTAEPQNQNTMKASIVQGKIKIQFPFNRKTVDDVKTLSNRRYNPDGRFWTAEVSVQNVKKLKGFGFELSAELSEMLNETPMKKIEEIEEVATIPGLKRELREYQKQGVAFINDRNGRALLADDMGLGKTMQAISYLQLNKDTALPALVICPASLKENWEREIQLSTDAISNIQILEGRTPATINPDAQVVIINYDVVEPWVSSLKAFRFETLIMDEAHKIKNDAAKRTKAVKSLARKIKRILPITGTPIENRPIEIFNALNLVSPSLFPNKFQFGLKYCAGKNNGFGWDFSGSSNMAELHQILASSIMIRRTKEEVLTELPDKIKSFVPMKLTNQSEYLRVRDSFIDYLRETKGAAAAEKASNAEVLAQIEYLKQAAVRGKMTAMLSWIDDFIEDSDEKLVLFGVHSEVLNALYTKYSEISVKIDGGVPPKNRLALVDKFNNDPKIRLMIGNIEAAGVGLNMTSASKVAIIELPWTPGALNQAIDRVHRMGQTKGVEVFFLLAKGTIEEEIAQMLDSKQKNIKAILDGEEVEEYNLLGQLILKIAA